jgi:hypothetical protein
MDEQTIAGPMSVHDPSRSRAVLADLRAALRRGHGQQHHLELLGATRDLTADEAARLVAWPMERARLRRDLERLSREFAAVLPADMPPSQAP